MLHGDVLIHCGDFCNGYQNDGHSIAEIDRWFGMQQFELILTIGGNHDFLAESLFERSETVFENASYLVDTEYIHKGVTFYGSPWLPDLDGWANYLPDKKRQKKWERIPASVDVLITHTPPFGILDRPRSGRQIGCKSLRSAVDRVRPQVHCFGHVHASPGRISKAGTEFINATVINSDIEVCYGPRVVEVEV